jgi:hypothetical protein
MTSRAGSSRAASTAGGPSPGDPGRHGLCPDCGRAFRLEGGELPPEGLVMDCPACEAPLPLPPAPRRKRPYRIVSRPLPGAPGAVEGPAAPSGAERPSSVPVTPEPAAERAVTSAESPSPRKAPLEKVARPAPRRRGALLPLTGLLLGLAGGAGLLALLASRSGSLGAESLLALPLWARIVAAALPLLGLGGGLLLRRRR